MDWFQGGAAAVILLVAAGSDMHRRIIPDWTVIGVALLYVLPTLWDGRWQEVGLGMVVAVLVFAGGTFLFWRGWIGGGDVKLAAALALWAGTTGIVPFLLLTSLVGGVVSVVCLGCSVAQARIQGRVFRRDMVRVPYGVALVLGGVPFVFASVTGQSVG